MSTTMSLPQPAPATGEPSSGESAARRQRVLRVLFAGWIAACAVFVFWDTFRLPYALDDLDQLHALALLRAGDLSFWRWLGLNHNEHIVPLLRLMFWASTWVSGLDAWPFRVAMLAIHCGGALVCSLLAHRASGSRLALWVTATAYAGAGGFAGSAVWEPTISIFAIAAALLGAALLLLIDSKGGPAALCGSLALAALSYAAFPGAIAASVSIPILVACRPPGAVSRRTMLVTYLLVTCAAALATRAVLSAQGAVQYLVIRPAGLAGGAWLILTAPFKFAASWLPLSDPTVSAIALCSALGWAVLLIACWKLPRPALMLLASLWAGAASLALLTGAARSSATPLSLFLTDRYYYLFLAPLALQAGLVAARLNSVRRLRFALAGLVCAGMVVGLHGSRMKLRSAVPWEIYRMHDEAIARGQALAQLVNAAARHSGPLVLAEGPIPFDGVHKDKIGLACLVLNDAPCGASRIRLVPGPIPGEAAAVENRILDGWSAGLGIAPPVCVVAGRIEDARSGALVDFRKGSFDFAVAGGFHNWERTYRWMTRSGTVRVNPGPGELWIRAHAPLDLLRRKWPGLAGVRVSVKVAGEPVGAVIIDRIEEQEFRLTVPAVLRAGSAPVEVTFTSALTWHPRDVIPATGDERELSIALIGIGFQTETTASLPANCSERFRTTRAGH